MAKITAVGTGITHTYRPGEDNLYVPEIRTEITLGYHSDDSEGAILGSLRQAFADVCQALRVDPAVVALDFSTVLLADDSDEPDEDVEREDPWSVRADEPRPHYFVGDLPGLPRVNVCYVCGIHEDQHDVPTEILVRGK